MPLHSDSFNGFNVHKMFIQLVVQQKHIIDHKVFHL